MYKKPIKFFEINSIRTIMSILSVVVFFQAICLTIVLSDIDIEDYPYQVALLRDDSGVICAAGLFSNNVVVVASHCTASNIDVNVVVRSGSSETATTATTYQVSGDLALLKLDPPISFNESVQPIPISDRNPIAGDSCVVPGWVEIEDDIDVQLTNIVILATPVCQLLSLIPLLNLQRLCGLNVGACVNDLGAPLVCNGKLAGIRVGSSPCAAGVPQVYANVDAIRALLAAGNQ